MSDDRKLWPTAEGPGSDEHADEPPFDEAEVLAAAATRALLEGGHDPLASALRAAWGGDEDAVGPDAPAPFDHEALIARALREAPSIDAPASEEPAADDAEMARAGAVRDGIHRVLRGGDAGREPQGDALALATALRAAYAPKELPPLRHELILTRALGRGARRRTAPLLAMAAGALALAASVALMLRSGDPRAPQATMASAPGAIEARPSMIQARSTADLFDPAEPFPATGGSSARIDRIASARASDLRDNRFAAWGVR